MKSKILAGFLALLFGGTGLHKFYLGYKKEGCIMLALTLFTFGVGASLMQIVSVIEAISYFVKSDEDFHAIYAEGYRGWF